MLKLTIEFKSLDQVKENIRTYGFTGQQLMGRALFVEGERIMAESKVEVPVYLGVLRASGRVNRPEFTTRGVSVELSYGGAASAYAFFVHEGTQPHWPPIAPLKEWAQRVLGDENIGFLIARKISRVGTAPTKYLERPLLDAVKGFDARIANTFFDELEMEFRAR